MYILAYNDCYDNDYITIFVGTEDEIIDKVQDLICTDRFYQELNNMNDVIAYLDYKFVGNENATYISISDMGGKLLVQC